MKFLVRNKYSGPAVITLTYSNGGATGSLGAEISNSIGEITIGSNYTTAIDITRVPFQSLLMTAQISNGDTASIDMFDFFIQDGEAAPVQTYPDFSALDNGNISVVTFSIALSSSNLIIAQQVMTAYTTAQQTIFDALTPEQQAVVSSLTAEQQVTMLSGTAAQKNALIATLTPAQQSAFTSTPVQFIETAEQVANDKLRTEQVVNKLKNNAFISDDDAVFYTLGNSLMAVAAMAEIDSGRGFDGLRNIGLTQPQALKVLSIYNVTIDTNKYESEMKLTELAANPALIVSLQAYLVASGLELPPITDYLATIRANHGVYLAMKDWIVA